MYDTIQKKITLGTVTLKNRIVFAPTSMGLKEEEYIQKISDIAKGGAALIIIGDVSVMPSRGVCLHTEEGFGYYSRVVDAIHRNGAKACAQLHMSDSNFQALVKYIPDVKAGKISEDQLRVLLNEEVSPYITNLPLEKVKEIIRGFGTTAQLAQKAGFDLVQVHGDRMCGSFSSPIFNKREDCYGGTLENRLRFAIEAVQEVKKAIPNSAIDFKLAVRMEEPHYGNAGITMEEIKTAVPLLEQAGVTSFHVTLANHSDLNDTIPPKNHPYFKEEGCFLPFCDEVKKYTKLPVCGVGALSNPQFIEEQLQNGRMDLVGMCRQLIADPEWGNKVANGEEEEIKHCIRCNQKCLGGMKAHLGVHCIYDGKRK